MRANHKRTKFNFAARSCLAPTQCHVLPAGSSPTAKFVFLYTLGYVRPYLIWLAIAFVFSMIGRGLQLSVPLLVTRIIDAASIETKESTFYLPVLCLFAVVAAGAAVQFSCFTLFDYVGQKVVLGIRSDIFSKMMSLSLDFFERRPVGELVSRVVDDSRDLHQLATTLPANVLRKIVTIVGGICLIASYSMRLSVVLVAYLPVVLIIAIAAGRTIRRVAVQVQDQLAMANVVLEESLTGIGTVKRFVREGFEIGRNQSLLRKAFQSRMHRTLVEAGSQSIVTLVVFWGLVAMIWYASTMIRNGTLTPGSLIAFVVYAILVGHSLAGVSAHWTEWQNLQGVGQRVFQLLGENPTVADRPGAQSFDGTHELIQFQNVSFAYPSDPQELVLREVSFSIKRGQTVALVGESGAGKSTVAALLLRLYDVTSGAITIDGVDIRDFKQSDIRRAIAVVSQEVMVFGRSLRENILYGRLDASDDEIVSAANVAHALEFIDRTPNGFATLAGARGMSLSGGERQRIAIARAILKDPAILILDEATSALDNHNEALIKDALSNLMVGRTTMVIAHRLSTIENADHVFVLHEGRIVESGTHAELLDGGGHYARLYRCGRWQAEGVA